MPSPASPDFHRIGIVLKAHAEAAQRTLTELTAWLAARGFDIVLDESAGALECESCQVERDRLPELVDLIIVLGGDGTLLSVSRSNRQHQIPLLAVNLGGLGFLTAITLQHLYQDLEAIFDGRYSISRRMMLDLEVIRNGQMLYRMSALNDIVFNNATLARIIELEAVIDGRYVTVYRGDGLIIATPTGSTAYSLAAGGPIVEPTMGALLLTPICPHTLNQRPLVVSDLVKIEVVLRSTHADSVTITLDGQVSCSVISGDQITVQKSAWQVPLIQYPSEDFFQVLRTKLKWGTR